MNSWILISIYILLSIFFYYYYLCSIQLNGYKIYKIIDNNNKKLLRFTLYNLFNSITFISINIVIYYFDIQYLFLSNMLYLLFFTLLLVKNKNNFNKTPLKFTNRLIRLYVSNILIFSLILCLINFYFNYYILILLPIIQLINLIFIVFIFYLTLPFEKLNNYRYIIKAEQRFNNKNIIKIAITGSYAKSSVKNILTHILSAKYNTITTEKNYNTELGLCISSNNITDKTEIFVAEFGARKQGDITKLCKIYNPQIAVITGICNQHLETFKNINNIIKTKSEILANTKLAFFNGNNNYVTKMFDTFNNEKYITFSRNCYVEDINYSNDSTTFTMVLYNEKIHCSTKLLGKSCIENILLSSLIAYKLGVPIQDIQKQISTLEYIPHRLQIIKNNNLTIIDDSYNSNIVGINEALFVLNLYNNTRVVLVSGMVELGKNEKETNYNLGIQLSKNTDKIILIKTKQSQYILQALTDNNYPQNNIFIFNTINEAICNFSHILDSRSVLLLMSDLPSNYSV